jgi:hypothetical protein
VSRILWIAPHNIHLEPIIGGLESLGQHEICIHWLGNNGFPVDRGMLNEADRFNPNIIIYTGENGGYLVPSIGTLIALKKMAPTVFMCHDASDVTWTRFLNDYHAYDVFSVIVNIDGSNDWPKGPNDITALTPHDQRFYE